MTRHNFLQKRAKLLKAMRAASVDYLWHMNFTTPQGKRATTLAARRLSEHARNLWRLGTMPARAGEEESH